MKLIAGSLRKKKSRYYYTVSVNGKKYSDVATGKTNKLEATIRANDMYKEFSSGVFEKREDPRNNKKKTLYNAIDDYLTFLHGDVVTGKIVQGTFREKQIAFNVLKSQFPLEKLLSEVTPKDIEKMYQRIAAQKSIRSLGKYHSFYKKMFRRCLRDGEIAANPFDLVDSPKRVTNRRAGKSLTAEELNRYVQFLLENYPVEKEEGFLTIAVLLGAFGGLRREEVVGLKSDSLEFLDTGEMRASIENVIVSSGGKIEERNQTKTEASHDTVVFPQFVANLVLKRIEVVSGTTADKLTSPIYLISDFKNNFIKPDRVTRNHKRALEKASISPVRFHDLRHTHATILLDNGVPIPQVSKRLRHKNPSITLDVYYSPHKSEIDNLGKAFNEAVLKEF